jgi:hypothetical protein
MTIPDRIYERTEAGLKALLDPDSALRAETRGVLGLVKTRTHADLVRVGTRNYPAQRISEALAELEKLGFIKSFPATSEHDLDFTGGYAPLKV